MLSKFDRDVVPLLDDGISEVEQYRSALRTLHSQAVIDAQSNFVPKQSPWIYFAWIIIIWILPIQVHLHYSCLVTFRSLPAPQFLKGPHHCRHDKCLPGLWSGTTLRWTFVPVPCLPDTTDNARTMGRPRMQWLIFSSSMTADEREELWTSTTITSHALSHVLSL